MGNAVPFRWPVPVPDSAVFAPNEPVAGAVEVQTVGVEGGRNRHGTFTAEFERKCKTGRLRLQE